MSDKHQWPPEVPSTGTVINQMSAHLDSGLDAFLVMREEMEGWRWCMIEVAALLDPDNPPSTPEQMAKMKMKLPKLRERK